MTRLLRAIAHRKCHRYTVKKPMSKMDIEMQRLEILEKHLQLRGKYSEAARRYVEEEIYHRTKN